MAPGPGPFFSCFYGFYGYGPTRPKSSYLILSVRPLDPLVVHLCESNTASKHQPKSQAVIFSQRGRLPVGHLRVAFLDSTHGVVLVLRDAIKAWQRVEASSTLADHAASHKTAGAGVARTDAYSPPAGQKTRASSDSSRRSETGSIQAQPSILTTSEPITSPAPPSPLSASAHNPALQMVLQDGSSQYGTPLRGAVRPRQTRVRVAPAAQRHLGTLTAPSARPSARVATALDALSTGDAEARPGTHADGSVHMVRRADSHIRVRQTSGTGSRSSSVPCPRP